LVRDFDRPQLAEPVAPGAAYSVTEEGSERRRGTLATDFTLIRVCVLESSLGSSIVGALAEPVALGRNATEGVPYSAGRDLR